MAKIRQRRLTTVTKIDEAYDAVHGRAAFRRLLACTKQQLSNYKRNNRFPPDSFLIVGAALKRLRCEAPPELWGIMDLPQQPRRRVVAGRKRGVERAAA